MDDGLIVVLVSGGFLVVGAILWQSGSHLIANGKKAKAVIFKNNFEGDKNGGVYYPVVRFLTDRNEWITQQLRIGYAPAKTEGTKLEVIYDPDDPTNVEINSSFQLEVLPRLFVALGICGFIAGVLMYVDIISID